MENLEKLFVHQLGALYSAEKQIVKALPKLVSAAETRESKEAFLSHLKEAKDQVERLEQIFATLKKKPTAKACLRTKGALEEAAEFGRLGRVCYGMLP